MLRILALLAILALPAQASAQCALDQAARDIAVETERFERPGIRPQLEDVARMLVPSLCTRDGNFSAIDLGLVAEDLRQGTEFLESRRLERAHSPAQERITANGLRNSQ